MTTSLTFRQLVDSAEFQKSLAALENLREVNPQAYSLLIGFIQLKAFHVLNTFRSSNKDQEVA